MKRELLSIDNGKLSKNGGIIFDGLFLHVFRDEIAGIICDDIQTKRYLNEFLLGGLNSVPAAFLSMKNGFRLQMPPAFFRE